MKNEFPVWNIGALKKMEKFMDNPKLRAHLVDLLKEDTRRVKTFEEEFKL